MADEAFVDYYKLLDLSPKASPEEVERAVRSQLEHYDPESSSYGDAQCYELVKHARRTLTEAGLRAAYDKEHKKRMAESAAAGSLAAGTVRKEWKRRQDVLTALYLRRMDHPLSAVMSANDVARATGAPSAGDLEFAFWFLRDEGLAKRTENGAYEITSPGARWVEERVLAAAESAGRANGAVAAAARTGGRPAAESSPLPDSLEAPPTDVSSLQALFDSTAKFAGGGTESAQPGANRDRQQAPSATPTPSAPANQAAASGGGNDSLKPAQSARAGESAIRKSGPGFRAVSSLKDVPFGPDHRGKKG